MVRISFPSTSHYLVLLMGCTWFGGCCDDVVDDCAKNDADVEVSLTVAAADLVIQPGATNLALAGKVDSEYALESVEILGVEVTTTTTNFKTWTAEVSRTLLPSLADGETRLVVPLVANATASCALVDADLEVTRGGTPAELTILGAPTSLQLGVFTVDPSMPGEEVSACGSCGTVAAGASAPRRVRVGAGAPGEGLSISVETAGIQVQGGTQANATLRPVTSEGGQWWLDNHCSADDTPAPEAEVELELNGPIPGPWVSVKASAGSLATEISLRVAGPPQFTALATSLYPGGSPMASFVKTDDRITSCRLESAPSGVSVTAHPVEGTKELVEDMDVAIYPDDTGCGASLLLEFSPIAGAEEGLIVVSCEDSLGQVGHFAVAVEPPP